MKMYYISEREEVANKLFWLKSKGYTSEYTLSLLFRKFEDEDYFIYTDKEGRIEYASRTHLCMSEAYAEELKWKDIKDDEIFKPKFEMGDLVLVRNNDCQYWIATRYYCCDENFHFKVYFNDCTVFFNQCIPFEGNEHLIGTTHKPTED